MANCLNLTSQQLLQNCSISFHNLTSQQRLHNFSISVHKFTSRQLLHNFSLNCLLSAIHVLSLSSKSTSAPRPCLPAAPRPCLPSAPRPCLPSAPRCPPFAPCQVVGCTSLLKLLPVRLQRILFIWCLRKDEVADIIQCLASNMMIYNVIEAWTKSVLCGRLPYKGVSSI